MPGWASLIWTLVIYGLVAYIVYWIWGKVSSYIPEPFRVPIVVIGAVVIGAIVIGLITSRVPLIPCCVIGGVQLV